MAFLGMRAVIMNVNFDELRRWIGRSQTQDDTVTPVPVAALAATLDRDDPLPQPGDELPPLWHWIYFLPLVRHSELGPDGHPRRGGFLPPVPLPRRMWAGGRFEFFHPLRVGESIRRTSRIADVSLKEGRSGTLVFVRVRHEVSNDAGVALAEEQDIVYREAPRPGETPPAPKAAPLDAAWHSEIVPDPVLLFRYSALTFNGHRIHYDHPYTTQVEGYPGLVVHGPLTATLLVDLLRRHLPRMRLERFSFRAVRPLYAPRPFTVCGKLEADGKTATLWTRDADGWVTMEASATLA